MLHIDGDALVYLAGFAADSRDGPFSHSAHNIKLIINKALDVTGEIDYRIFLTNKDSNVNFRTQIFPEYKQNRKKICKKCNSEKISKETYVDRIYVGENITKRRFHTCLNCHSPVDSKKPVYYNKIRQYLVEKYGAMICEWGEADDWLHPGSPDWIATHDKDIPQRPGKYYNIKSGEILEFDEAIGKIYLTKTKQLKGYGFKWFCAQMITGDSIDNIPKPYKGDGPVWIMKVFEPLTTMKECWNMVKLYYRNSGNESIFWRQAQLLWCARRRKQICSEEVIEEIVNN